MDTPQGNTVPRPPSCRARVGKSISATCACATELLLGNSPSSDQPLMSERGMDDGSRVHQGKLRGDVVAGFGLIDGELCCRYAVHLALQLALDHDMILEKFCTSRRTIHLCPFRTRTYLPISRDAALILSSSIVGTHARGTCSTIAYACLLSDIWILLAST